MTATGFEFHCPTKIICGRDALDKLPVELQSQGMTHPLVMTDAGLVKLGVAAKLTNVLDAAGVAYDVFDQVPPDSSMDVVNEVAHLYQQRGCDGFVALGGGSVIDTAKGAAASLSCEGVDFSTLQGAEILTRDMPPFIAVPTTAGTGSEVTLVAVVADTHKHAKLSFTSYKLVPHAAILDPALTATLPPKLTATTGMDALTHAVEAYIGRSTTRQTRQEALEATRLVFANVERAYRNGKDYEARSNMLTAAYRAGIAFSRSYVGYVHAVAHSLGGQYNIPHGLANAVLLPYVLESYGSCIHRKLHDLAVAAGIADAQESDAGAAAKFIRAIRQLNARMGIPETLEGIRPEDIPVMAAHAEKEANPLYPVPRLMTREELTFFYEQVAGKECHGQQAS